MSRVQLALNVSNIDQAVDFYTKLFKTEPAKLRPGYANFAITDPPLKLVLIENDHAAGSLNHLGVEVFSTDEVRAAKELLVDEGLSTATEDNVTCCYAVQDKVWTTDPDGAPWEIYTVLEDSELGHGLPASGDSCGPGACESSEVDADQTGESVSACC